MTLTDSARSETLSTYMSTAWSGEGRYDGLDAVIAAIAEGAQHSWPFHITIPPQIAPSMGRFGWELRATAALQSGSPITASQGVRIEMSPVTAAIAEIVRTQFGFQFDEAGADEDGLWMTFRPTGAVSSHFRGLEIAWDEQEDEIALWVRLMPFKAHVIERYRDAFDEREGSIEVIVPKGRFVASGQVDVQGLTGLLRPMFSL